MRPPIRLLQPLEAPTLRSSKTLYVCSNCRYDVSLSPAVIQQHQTRRHAGSGNTPFTEKLRRRIWGTDEPPGLEDPYGGEGVIARQWNKRKAQYLGKKGEESEHSQQERDLDEQFDEDEEPWDYRPTQSFVPATTAHNLKRMGYLGVWTDFPPTKSDEYRPFLSRTKATKSAHFHAAAQSVAVEMCILHELKKPLSLACEILQHHPSIWGLIKRCKISNSDGATSLDGLIKFPDEKVKEDLFFVFKQLGENVESQADEQVEAPTEQISEAEETSLTAEVITADSTEESIDPEADIEVDESESTLEADEVYSHAVKAENRILRKLHEGYLKFPLADPAIKFAFLKRFAQITGHPIQDNNAYTAQTVKDVVEHFEKIVCQPTKLAVELSLLKSQEDLPNVAINHRRYTKLDQDRDVGRAKVVEEALRERGLIRTEEEKRNRFRL